MIVNILVSLIGILIFLFVFWRRIKEDYASDVVFTAGFLVVAGIILGGLISKQFFPSWWFWASTVGASLGILLGIVRFSLRPFETVEAGVIGLLPWVILIFWLDSIKNSSLVSLIYSVGILALLGLFYFLDGHYKDFTWYKSGRVGFAGLTVAGFFFILRAAIAIFFPSVLSFVGKFEALVSALSAFIFFLLTFNLARSET